MYYGSENTVNYTKVFSETLSYICVRVSTYLVSHEGLSLSFDFCSSKHKQLLFIFLEPKTEEITVIKSDSPLEPRIQFLSKK